MGIQMSNNYISTPNANKLNLDDCYNQQCIAIPSISQSPPPDESCRPSNVTKTVQRQNQTITEDDQFNEYLVTLLNGQQDLQRKSLHMIQDMNCRHEYYNLM